MKSKKITLICTNLLFAFIFLTKSVLADDLSYKILTIDGKELAAKKLVIKPDKLMYDSKAINKNQISSISVINGNCTYASKGINLDFSKPSMKVTLDLVDGSHFDNIELIFDKKQYQFSLHDNKINLHDTSVRSLILKPEKIKSIKDWNEFLKEPNLRKDKLFISKKDSHVAIDGIFMRFDFNNQKVVFLWDNKERLVSIDKVIGILLSSKLVKKKEALIFHNSIIYGEEIILDKATITIKFLENQKITLASECIKKISLTIVETEYLSNLKPTTVESANILIENVKGFQNDKSIWNNTLSIGKKTFKRGIGVHSKSILKYTIPANARKFQTYVGIDGEVKNFGGCIFKILVDGNEEFVREVNSKNKEIKVNLNVENKKELTLIVLPGKNLDIGDHGTWGDAKFILK